MQGEPPPCRTPELGPIWLSTRGVRLLSDVHYKFDVVVRQEIWNWRTAQQTDRKLSPRKRSIPQNPLKVYIERSFFNLKNPLQIPVVVCYHTLPLLALHRLFSSQTCFIKRGMKSRQHWLNYVKFKDAPRGKAYEGNQREKVTEHKFALVNISRRFGVEKNTSSLVHSCKMRI